MRLLREVMSQPMDPAYAMVANHRAAGDGPGRAAAVGTVLLALLCGWTVTRGVEELRRPEPGQVAGRAALEREITRRSAQADVQQQTIERLQAEIVAAQQMELTSARDVELAGRTQRLALLAGEVPATGSGLQVTLDDAPSVAGEEAPVDPRVPTDAENGRVLDRDLQVAVNGLWAAGAEAVSINGRRLTMLSAIRSAGKAILVDFRPLVPPYVISAVGDPKSLQSQFVADNAGSYLQGIQHSYGVDVQIVTATQLRLPGAGTFALRLARPVVSTTSSPSASSSPSSSLSPISSPSVKPPRTVSLSPSPAPSTEVGP
jgi:uncharacterized protein YlxW (UPF0749 family)